MKHYCQSCRNGQKNIAGRIISTVVKVIVFAIVIISAYQQFVK